MNVCFLLGFIVNKYNLCLQSLNFMEKLAMFKDFTAGIHYCVVPTKCVQSIDNAKCDMYIRCAFICCDFW